MKPDTQPTPHEMEPDTFGDTDADHVMHSIAISLKRIADAMTMPCNQYGEPFAEAIQGAIVRGMKGIQ